MRGKSLNLLGFFFLLLPKILTISENDILYFIILVMSFSKRQRSFTGDIVAIIAVPIRHMCVHGTTEIILLIAVKRMKQQK